MDATVLSHVVFLLFDSLLKRIYMSSSNWKITYYHTPMSGGGKNVSSFSVKAESEATALQLGKMQAEAKHPGRIVVVTEVKRS